MIYLVSESTKKKIVNENPDVIIIAAAKVGGIMQIIQTELSF